MSMVLAHVLYDSLLFRLRSNVVYSGTVVDGMEPANAYDWRDFSIFRAQVGTVTLTLQVPNGGLVDSLVLWRPAGAPSAPLVTVSVSPDGSAWTPIGSTTAATDGSIKWLDLTPTTIPSAGYLRVTIADASYASDWRQISVGAKMQFPMGQWSGVTPPSLYSGVVLENVIAMGGSIVGRNVRRLEKKAQISLTHLTQAWVRNYWDAFAQHAAKNAFWYRWNPVGYPAEIAFAVAENIEAPANAMPPPYMTASMPLRCLT